MKQLLFIIITLIAFCSTSQGQHINISELKAPESSLLDTTFLGTVDGINYGFMMGNDGIFDKPAFILEGFDPFNETGYHSVFSHWRKSPVVASLLCSGYDIITVDFKKNHIDVLTNAAYVKELLKRVNKKKAGHQDGILAGESMGGIIGRVVLAELEHESYDHEIRLYVALDSPFKGANIPIGVQYMLADIKRLNRKLVNDAFKDETGYSIETISEALNAKAAQQLVIHHIADSSQYHFTHFQSYLAEIGYPQKTRNITLLNGSNTGENYPFQPGQIYFSLKKGWAPVLKLEIESYMTATNNTDQVVSVVRDYNFWHMRKPRKEYLRTYPSSNRCYDNAPGGYLNKLSFSNKGIEDFCFVPTSSAIDLTDSIFYSKNGLHYYNTKLRDEEELIRVGASPFDAIYCNATNDKHAKIYLIPDIEDFIRKEIFQEKH